MGEGWESGGGGPFMILTAVNFRRHECGMTSMVFPPSVFGRGTEKRKTSPRLCAEYSWSSCR